MGTFVINGAERVVVSQLVRSPGVYYSELEDPTHRPDAVLGQGDPEPRRLARVRDQQQGPAVGQGRPQAQDRGDDPAPRGRLRRRTTRSPGLFGAVDIDPEHPYIANTLDKDLTKTPNEALIEVYKKLRPGDPPTPDNARQLVESLFFNFRRYDLGRVGRYKFNKKLDGVAARMGIELPREQRTITREDIAAIVGHLIESNRGLHAKDDIDHLGNRRIRANGELIQNAFRIGLLRMERVVRERMTIQEIDKATPNALINIRPVVAAMKEFFGGSQLSPVHGPDEPAGRAHLQAAPVGPRPGRPVARARRVRRPRRPPQPLRPHLPDRDAGRPEHRPDRLARHLRADQRLRLHRDAVPQGQADRRPRRSRAARATRPARTSPARTARSSSRRASSSPRPPTRSSRARRRSRSRSGPIVTDEIDYLPADEEEEHHVAQANAPLDAEGHFIGERVPSPLPGHLPGGAPGPDRVHGRQPQAGRVRRDGADPVPRARRRQPRPHGLEHAAPGGAAPRARVADRRHRHGGPRRARLRPGRHRPARRRRDQRHGRADPGRGGQRRARRVQAAQVRPQQPGHLHQPAPDRHGRPARRGGRPPSRTPRPPRVASSRSAGTSSWRS